MSIKSLALDCIESAFGRAKTPVGVILCLHSVRPISMRNEFDKMEVSVEFLEALILHCNRNSIKIVSLDEATQQASCPTYPFISITFDDGYKDIYDHAFPLFIKYNTPFCVFVTTDLVDRIMPMWWHTLSQLIWLNETIRFQGEIFQAITNEQKNKICHNITKLMRVSNREKSNSILERLLAENGGESRLNDPFNMSLTWDMLRKMLDSNLFTVGSHATTHRMMSSLNENELDIEFAHSKRRLDEELGQDVEFFAYPFGQPDEIGTKCDDLILGSGYRCAFTTERRILTRLTEQNRFRLPRVMLGAGSQHPAILRLHMAGLLGQ